MAVWETKYLAVHFCRLDRLTDVVDRVNVTLEASILAQYDWKHPSTTTKVDTVLKFTIYRLVLLHVVWKEI